MMIRRGGGARFLERILLTGGGSYNGHKHDNDRICRMGARSARVRRTTGARRPERHSGEARLPLYAGVGEDGETCAFFKRTWRI